MQLLVNINDNVEVRLTPFGRKILREQRIFSSEDSKGYTRFQLWDLFNVFGQYIYMGAVELPFETNIKIYY